MHLIPREVDKLLLHQAGFLAQKRLARGLRLNYPEATALIAAVVLERIRDGEMSVADLMDHGRQLLGTRQVQASVPEMVYTVQVEGTFRDGTKLVTIHSPISSEDGDLNLALYGSFLPVPDLKLFSKPDPEAGMPKPGEFLIDDGELVLNEGRETVTLDVVNTGDRPIQIGSHYPFVETNRFLSFDREQAYGFRLDIPAGTAVRFEPGEKKTVNLVQVAGDRRIFGGNNLGGGHINDYNRERTMARIKEQGFKHQPQARK
ncbi:MAG TPA: urease subunit beta [Planctomycetaceae bacterium]|nr:urease subunit beta [Planctomycetaceae bacterium]HQZ68758.1 urease subunit beta [Planctomycetaceae bacterium]